MLPFCCNNYVSGAQATQIVDKSVPETAVTKVSDNRHETICDPRLARTSVQH